MKDIFIASNNIFTPIALTASENFLQIKANVSGIKIHDDKTMLDQPFYASLFDNNHPFLNDVKLNRFTKFEKLLIGTISDAITNSGVTVTNNKTLLIISTTKGNISLLETETNSKELRERISLNASGKLIAEYFHFANKPIVISNACISGLVALITGMRLIQAGQYDNVVVAGADVISKFVLTGFQSFQAISAGPCKPFDVARDGINLGEGAATIILSSSKKYSQGIKISGGAISNDANHISGPSRTGEELNFAISKAMKIAKIATEEIGFISAHGTATIYNDEMEANAIALAKLQSIPVNSLKGYYGHTLGAAGLIESIISIHSLRENLVLPTRGFSKLGVTKPINICTSLHKKPLQNCLKTASGFGGCNAAVLFTKQ